MTPISAGLTGQKLCFRVEFTYEVSLGPIAIHLISCNVNAHDEQNLDFGSKVRKSVIEKPFLCRI